MSIIDNANHSVVKFDPKSSKPFANQRLSKVSYKKITDKNNPLFGIDRESQCVSIPMLDVKSIEQNMPLLMPHVVEFLQGVQDKIIREKVDAGNKHIANEDISVSAMIDWLESNNESGRLTKETVAKWFAENIEDSLTVVLADKLGIDDNANSSQIKQLEIVVGQFKDKVSSLAGGKTSYEPKMCDSLIKCLELAPSGDSLSGRFINRLNKMKEDANKNVDLLDLL